MSDSADPIPDGWPPPEEASGEARSYPVFPLPDVWLFPGAILPLHVFEERYRRMVEDSLDGPGRLVIGTVQAGHGHDMEGSPPFYPVAGLGEIGRHDRLPDGRFQIVVVGLRRVLTREIETDTPYRMVVAEELDEPSVSPADEEELRRDLVEAIRERTADTGLVRSMQGGKEVPAGEIPDTVPISYLADILLMGLMPLPHDVVNGIYREIDPTRRAQSALAEHAQRPKG